MDHMKILKRAWEITRHYRALWIFGIIIALTTASGGGSGGGGSGGGGGGRGNNQSYLPTFIGSPPVPGVQSLPPAITMPRLVKNANLSPDVSSSDSVVQRLKTSWHTAELSAPATSTLLAIGISVACLVLLLIILSIIGHYLSQTSLIRMVDAYEASGQHYSVRQGFRLGWSRDAGRLFLIDLLVRLPAAFIFILLFLICLAPLLLWATGSTAAGIIGTVFTIGLFFLVLLAVIIAALGIMMWTHVLRRVCVLEGLGVTETIGQGYALVRRRLKDVLIMWLILIGVAIVWMMAMVVLFILLLIVGGVLGGLVALLVGGLSSLFLEGSAPWIVAAVAGGPILIAVVAVPLLFLDGLMETFKSSVWTLTYRELQTLEALKPEGGPALQEVIPAAG